MNSPKSLPYSTESYRGERRRSVILLPVLMILVVGCSYWLVSHSDSALSDPPGRVTTEKLSIATLPPPAPPRESLLSARPDFPPPKIDFAFLREGVPISPPRLDPPAPWEKLGRFPWEPGPATDREPRKPSTVARSGAIPLLEPVEMKGGDPRFDRLALERSFQPAAGPGAMPFSRPVSVPAGMAPFPAARAASPIDLDLPAPDDVPTTGLSRTTIGRPRQPGGPSPSIGGEIPVARVISEDYTGGHGMPLVACPEAAGRFTSWMTPLQLNDHIRGMNRGHRTSFWERGHWIIAVEGRVASGVSQFRIVYEPSPRNSAYQWRYRIAQTGEDFARMLEHHRRTGFRLVHSQVYVDPDNVRRYQAVWHRLGS